MSIITCPECHEKISTLAVTCPHCGAPMEKTVELTKSALADTSKQETAPAAPENVSKKIALKMIGLAIILVGVGIIIYQITAYNPSAIELSRGTSPQQYFRFIPSIIMFLAGGAFWKAGG